MPGPVPKTASTRARRNRVAGSTTLNGKTKVKRPPLPDAAGITWHPMTLKWWADVWASPMAPEYDESDRHGLYLLAVLVTAFWLEPSQQLAAEIRLQRACFGLTPIDRRKLQWEIDRGEEATAKTTKRRSRSTAAEGEEPTTGTRRGHLTALRV